MVQRALVVSPWGSSVDPDGREVGIVRPVGRVGQPMAQAPSREQVAER